MPLGLGVKDFQRLATKTTSVCVVQEVVVFFSKDEPTASTQSHTTCGQVVEAVT